MLRALTQLGLVRFARRRFGPSDAACLWRRGSGKPGPLKPNLPESEFARFSGRCPNTWPWVITYGSILGRMTTHVPPILIYRVTATWRPRNSGCMLGSQSCIAKGSSAQSPWTNLRRACAERLEPLAQSNPGQRDWHGVRPLGVGPVSCSAQFPLCKKLCKLGWLCTAGPGFDSPLVRGQALQAKIAAFQLRAPPGPNIVGNFRAQKERSALSNTRAESCR